MKTAVLSQRRTRPDFKPAELSIVASGAARMTMPELAALRKESLPNLPVPLSPLLLRHSDEQTLAALAAISKATKSIAMASKDFRDWAIVSSSRSLGRGAFAAVVDKYRSEGPWGVSVQVIPHCTAHAVAGTLSLAIGSHGPCSGTGGREVDAVLSAASILRQPGWCGAWIVFSAWLPELAIDTSGRPTSDSICMAAAIAVTRQRSACSLGTIRIAAPRAADLASRDASEGEASSVGFTEFLCDQSGHRRSWASPATSAVQIEVDLARGSWREPVRPTSADKIRRSCCVA
ncbi:MAG TPA: hypothetical protein VGM76_11815 [Lacipirellulaceae bacterium]|jgi:hypothetical protein